MLKKKLALILAVAGISAFAGAFAACGKSTEGTENDTEIYAVYKSYVTYAESNNETVKSYEEWLAEIKGDIGNGIKSIVKTGTEGNVDTYTVTFTDGTITTFTVTNGTNGTDGANGENGADGKDGIDGKDGTDGKDGVNGADGATWYSGAVAPTSEIGSDGDYYLNTSSYEIYNKVSGEWKSIGNIKGADGTNGTNGANGEQGEQGEKGNGIASVEKLSSEGLVDTYRITFTDGSYFDYTVTNGTDGAKGDQGEKGEKGEQGDAHQHDFTYDTAVYEEATCENSGLIIKYCACGVSRVEIEAQLTHTLKGSVSGEYICTTCGKVYADETATKPCDVQTIDMGDVKYTLSDDGSHFVAGKGSKISSATQTITLLTVINGIPVTEIGEASAGFYKATAKTEIVIPASISYIGDRAFEESKFTAISFESGSALTSIGERTFKKCGNVTSLTVPKNVASIGEQAFYSCGSLQTIAVEEGNAAYISENGVLYTADGKTLVAVPKAMTGELTVKDGVTTIGAYAVAACSKLTKIVFPDSVTAVKTYGLQNVSNGALEEVVFNGTLSEVGDYALSNLLKLTKISVSAEVIGNKAFQSCSDLVSVTLEEGVKEIGEYAFQASGITTVKLPASLEKIGSSAFTCYSLTSVFVAKNAKLTTVSAYAFQNAKLLTSAVLPSTVTTIGKNAFNGCANLKIYFEGDETAWQSAAGTASTLTVYFYSAEQPSQSGTFWYYDENGNPAVWDVTEENTANVLISHVYGGGGKGATPVSNSFIALTNYGTADADLTGYTLQYSSMRDATERSWETFTFNVIIPAGECYVILCNAETTSVATITFAEGEYNAIWDITIDNKQYSVRLCDKDGNTVDALGAAEDASAAAKELGEGTLVTDLSKQKIVYRLSSSDTGDNATDFGIISLKNSTAENAAQYKPTAGKKIKSTSSSEQ